MPANGMRELRISRQLDLNRCGWVICVNGARHGKSSATLTQTLTASQTITCTATITATPSCPPTQTSTPTFLPLDWNGHTCIAFPNPGRSQISFRLRLNEPGRVAIHLYNLAGEQVQVLGADLTQSENGLAWDCRTVSAGVYLARVLVDGREKTKLKVAVVK